METTDYSIYWCTIIFLLHFPNYVIGTAVGTAVKYDKALFDFKNQTLLVSKKLWKVDYPLIP